MDCIQGEVFQRDNTRPHIAVVTQSAVQSVDILPWPSESPDQSAVEHVWDIIKRQLQHHQHPALTVPTVWYVSVPPEQEVSKELGIPQNVISRVWQRFQDDNNVSRRYSRHRPRSSTPNEARYLAVTAKKTRQSTASDLLVPSAFFSHW
ncbi:transposable element Tcb1 transposase [Trichonephila clavipes]|nr:transposable element Tcb1 transposase [Trichonephila clavipes]